MSGQAIRIRLFGAFREVSGDATLQVRLPEGARVADLRPALVAQCGDRLGDAGSALVQCSAFADDERVLRDDEALGGLAEVAILPPVSGG